MTQTFDVSPVVPAGAEIPLPENVFFLQWQEENTLVEVYRPDVAGPGFPPILLASDALPLTMAKSENLGFYNTAAQPRRTFVRQIGVGPQVSKTSFIISTQWSDSRDPGICVYDWEAERMYGPLVLPAPQRQIIGPVKIGPTFLYFLAVEESSKLISLYRTSHKLEFPFDSEIVAAELLNTATAAGEVLAPVEYMMATDTHIGVLYFPGELITYQFGQTWVILTPSTTDTVPVTGMGKYRLEDRFSQPGLVIETGESFIVKERAIGQDNLETFITETSIVASELVYPSARQQKLMDDEIEIRFGAQNISPVRRWDTGAQSSSFTFPEPAVGFFITVGDREPD